MSSFSARSSSAYGTRRRLGRYPRPRSGAAAWLVSLTYQRHVLETPNSPITCAANSSTVWNGKACTRHGRRVTPDHGISFVPNGRRRGVKGSRGERPGGCRCSSRNPGNRSRGCRRSGRLNRHPTGGARAAARTRRALWQRRRCRQPLDRHLYDVSEGLKTEARPSPPGIGRRGRPGGAGRTWATLRHKFALLGRSGNRWTWNAWHQRTGTRGASSDRSRYRRLPGRPS